MTSDYLYRVVNNSSNGSYHVERTRVRRRTDKMVFFEERDSANGFNLQAHVGDRVFKQLRATPEEAVAAWRAQKTAFLTQLRAEVAGLEALLAGPGPKLVES